MHPETRIIRHWEGWQPGMGMHCILTAFVLKKGQLKNPTFGKDVGFRRKITSRFFAYICAMYRLLAITEGAHAYRY